MEKFIAFVSHYLHVIVSLLISHFELFACVFFYYGFLQGEGLVHKVKWSFYIILEGDSEHFQNSQTNTDNQRHFNVEHHVKKNTCCFCLFLNFNISTNLQLKLFQQKQHPFNEQVIPQSFLTYRIASDFLLKEGQDLIDGMITKIGSLDDKRSNEDKFIVGRGQILQGNIVESNVQINFWVLWLNKIKLNGNFFYKIEKSFGFFPYQLVYILQS